MAWQPGQASPNPNGAPKRSESQLRWEIIDKYIAKATQVAMDIVDGEDRHFKGITAPKEQVDAKLKAIGHLLKLAPQRQVGEDGGPIKYQATTINIVNPNGNNLPTVNQTIPSVGISDGSSHD